MAKRNLLGWASALAVLFPASGHSVPAVTHLLPEDPLAPRASDNTIMTPKEVLDNNSYTIGKGIKDDSTDVTFVCSAPDEASGQYASRGNSQEFLAVRADSARQNLDFVADYLPIPGASDFHLRILITPTSAEAYDYRTGKSIVVTQLERDFFYEQAQGMLNSCDGMRSDYNIRVKAATIPLDQRAYFLTSGQQESLATLKEAKYAVLAPYKSTAQSTPPAPVSSAATANLRGPQQ
ncbi:MAG TPA: hypothetical protein VFR09_04995 [Alphaproteobacteria bacterium]|nr:hypothetical protein [Alphaproteobacteria bacterium]